MLDASTGKTVHEQKLPGFLRLNAAGDGRRVMVTTGNAFRVFDTGIESQAHGDHHHNYEFQPGLTKVSYPAQHPGHVVVHGGRTALFGDGDGSVQLIPTEQVGSDVAPVQRTRTKAPHHGVAVALDDGTLLTTHGTEKSRSTVQARRGGRIIDQTTTCPGVHGEAVAHDDAVVFGCENGATVFRDGAFHPIKAKDTYARIGNLAATPQSPVVLGDYKVQPDAELERPTRISLLDTRTDNIRLVDLGSSYAFKSLARGPGGEGLVLTYDGRIAVVDVTSGKVTKRIPAISPWKEPKDWQDPAPSLEVEGDRAYVTDTAKNQLVVIDLRSGKATQRHALSKTPVEIAVTTGSSPDVEETEVEGGRHEGHDH